MTESATGKQNKIDPKGLLHALKVKGTLMGNRGQLHNAQQQIVRHWQLQRWITCTLAYKGIKRKLMAPNSYTELFFLDEPSSYAAGHRPCSTCQNKRYKAFQSAWGKAFPSLKNSAAEIDQVLHQARINADNSQRTWQATLTELPDGTMIEHQGQYVLLWRGQQWLWSFTGYSPLSPFVSTEKVMVLTPEPIVTLFKQGLAESLELHPSMPKDS